MGPMDMFPSAPALDLTPSPRDLTPPPRDMSPTTDMDTTDTMARGLLMPRLTPLSSMELMAMLVFPMPDMLPTELTPTLMELTPMCTVSPLDPALALTLSPRESSPRGLLMLMPLSFMEHTDIPMPMPMFLSAPALDLTPSPRDLTP